MQAVSLRSVSEYVSSGHATPSPVDDMYIPRCAYAQDAESALPSSFVVMPLGQVVQNGWSLKSDAKVPCRTDKRDQVCHAAHIRLARA
jgi:hypothetical protein